MASDELVEAGIRAVLKACHDFPEQAKVHPSWRQAEFMVRAALAVAEPAIRAEAAALIERRNPNEGGRLDALAIRAGQGEGRG